MKTVTITILEDGSTSIDLQNFHGQGCAQVMKDFTDGAGQITHERNKREYNERCAEQQQKRTVTQ